MASLFQQPTASQMLGQSFQQAQQKGGVPPSQLQQAVRQQVYNQPAQAQQQAQKQMTLMEFIRMLGGQQ